MTASRHPARSLTRRSMVLFGIAGVLAAIGCNSDNGQDDEEPTGTVDALNNTGVALSAVKLTGAFGTVTEKNIPVGGTARFIEVWAGGVTVTAYNAQEIAIASKSGFCFENETTTLVLTIPPTGTP